MLLSVSKSHVHELWGFKWNGQSKTFATSEEAAYPMEIASEKDNAFKRILQNQNWILERAGCSDSSFAAMRAITGQQPKASKFTPLVTEHKQCIRIEGPSESMKNLPCKTLVRCKQPVPSGCYSTIDIIPSDSQLFQNIGQMGVSLSQFRCGAFHGVQKRFESNRAGTRLEL